MFIVVITFQTVVHLKLCLNIISSHHV